MGISHGRGVETRYRDVALQHRNTGINMNFDTTGYQSVIQVVLFFVDMSEPANPTGLEGGDIYK